VLDVALGELPAGRVQQVLPRQIGARQGEGHHVLELIAEAEGAPGLVVAGPRPQPAAQVLVEQPAVHQQVEGVVRRAHLDRVEREIPGALHLDERGLGRRHPTMAAHELVGRRHVAPVAEQKHEASRLPGFEIDGHVQCRAGVEPRPEQARERDPGEGGRVCQGAVAAEERRSVARRRAEGLAGAREGHLSRVLGVVGIAGQDRSGRLVELGHDVEGVARARRTQDPLVVGEDAQLAPPLALVGQGEPGELDRVLRIHEDVELLFEPVR
jgi:hypothetical protein